MAEWYVPLKDVAQWIWMPRDRALGAKTESISQTVLFHKTVTPPAGTATVELYVSAEGRYTLWLNDAADPLGHGPARMDRQHRALDHYTVEVEVGRGFELWSQVRWFFGPPDQPVAEVTGSDAAFIVIVLFLDADGRILGKMGTDKEWNTRLCTGIRGTPIVDVPGYVAVGDFEHQRSSGWPAEWRKGVSPPAAGWLKAEEHAPPYFKHDPEIPFAASFRSWLIPREIAHTEYGAMPIKEIRRMKGVAVDEVTPIPYEPVETLNGYKLGANESVTFRCDMGEYSMGYYRVRLAGQGTSIAITSAEVLSGGLVPSTADENFMVRSKKSFSLDSPLPLIPFIDTFTLDTAEARTMESSHWRAFRFLEITLTAGQGGGELETITLHSTGYPFEADYAFEVEGSDESVKEITRKSVDVSWRTLKRCTWETYMDCPYYEQLQYIGDTRITCLITYLTTGDTTLPVQAIRAFDRSRTYEGLTQSRYPSNGLQNIPTFCFIYILMIEDYLKYTGDDAIVSEVRPGIAPILNWFSQYSDHETGLVGYVPYWPFVDWVNGWKFGVPPHAGKGPGFSNAKGSGVNAAVNLFHLLALQAASNIYERAKPGSGNFYAARAAGLKQRIYDTFFDAGRGLICEIPVSEGRGKLGVWGQQSQALAVLADVLSPTEAREAMKICLDPKNAFRADESVSDVEGSKAGKYGGRFVAPASIYFLFYVAEALAKLRMGEYLWPIMEPFRSALERGSTTWPESLEPSRSECHAWSSWPLYFYARHVLGISPPSLEDNKVRVRPLECAPFASAKGRFQTHRGPVSVEVSWKDGVREVTAKGLGVEVVGE